MPRRSKALDMRSSKSLGRCIVCREVGWHLSGVCDIKRLLLSSEANTRRDESTESTLK